MTEALFTEARALLRDGQAERAAALFLSAAEAGDAAAMQRCAAFAAGGIGQQQDWPRALDWLRRAADAGDATAARQLGVLGGDHIDIESLLAPPPLQSLTDEARIGVAREFAPPGFSAWIIEQGRERLAPSTASNSETGGYEVRSVRTATTSGFGPLKRDLVVAVLQERAARLTGTPVTHHEPPMLISYEPGQSYGAHYDFIPPKLAAMAGELERLGQRTFTLVTYLSDDFSGGATQFPTLGLELRGGVGEALVFANVLPDGAPDRRMLHAGLPPTAGRKWVLSQWLRSKPQPVR
ncbi:MAG TPA: 2OG-Fe(II) oxygenase [Vitreimonas sp.]|uniref:prolyl hydroxylase family protein n=1 Tax=Vitreimonas sp. TaxID=3069702 RepID=UPI002D2248C3|nr:2OG-Fe(II) oxygenase [Vitreimonas sp.]HYD85897.1 2OG-Fe(II) oxygenase [Vitreimonas sp.]